jgi:putative methyltransferase (TIGR04325 family)
MKSVLKQILPPVLIQALKPSIKYGWFGDYSSWEEAEKNCSGYDSDLIFNKIQKAVLSVQTGEAKFERDGTLFYKEEYNWQLVAALLMAASSNQGVLYVTDFGGSLGSSYFQHKKLLSFLEEIKWCVIEQKHFVDFGKKHLELNEFIFCNNIQDCLKQQHPQILILSSVLQYLEKPFEMIDDFLNFDYNYIFIDRTAFTKKNRHELTVQKVDPEIYPASYPSWFFNESIFLKPFLLKYELITDFENDDFTNKKNTYFKGFLLRRKSDEQR